MADQLVEFKAGKIVCRRWKVMDTLGSGGCGAVYECAHVKHTKYRVAVKVEAPNLEDGGVLKLEAMVLRELKARQNVVRLIDSGKRDHYTFIAMTLCGPDLMYLKQAKAKNKLPREAKRFSEATILRVAVHALYAIKQLHEIAFVHRDVKPGNMVTGGGGGRDSRTIFLIDYGMARTYAIKDPATGKYVVRKPRNSVLLRGTLRYCSENVHRRLEQGRQDDLWSLLYMLVELYVGLPWSAIKEEPELLKQKSNIGDDKLFLRCPVEFRAIADHLRTLKYEDRPNYKLIYDQLAKGIQRVGTSFFDPWDWENEDDYLEANQTALSISERTSSKKKPLTRQELEWKSYPTTHPKQFEENSIGI